MKKWITVLLSLLLLAGCQTPVPPSTTSPVPTVEPTPEPTLTPAPENLSPVYTDWSKLTPYEPQTPLYTLHPGYRSEGPLEPRDDYGVLLPYIGRYSTMEQYVIDVLPFWGLVTDKGELVCPPVYTGISFLDGFLLLSQANPTDFDPEDPFSGTGYSFTLAAEDGSWIHDLAGGYGYVHSGNGLLLTSAADGSLTLWNRDGETEARFDSALFTPWLGDDLSWGGEGGPYVDWTDGRVGYVTSYVVNGEYQENPILLYLDFSSGAVLDAPPPGYSAEIDYSASSHSYDLPVPPETEGGYSLSPIRDQVTGEVYFEGYYRSHPEDESVSALFDREGRLLVTGCDLVRFEQTTILRSGLCSTIENGFFCFRSLRDNSLVFRYPMGTNSD